MNRLSPPWILLLLLTLCAGPALGQSESLVPAAPAAALPCGAFLVRWEPGAAAGPQLRVVRADDGREVWASVPGRVFLRAGIGAEEVRQSRHSFRIRDRLRRITSVQSVAAVHATPGGALVVGELRDGAERVPYALRFWPRDAETLEFSCELGDAALATRRGIVPALAARAAAWSAAPAPSAGAAPWNRLYLRYASAPDERFLGFGEQFTHLDLKGRYVPIWAQEQGQGRGAQPLTWFFNTFGGGLGGDALGTYTAAPLYLTSLRRGLLLHQSEYLAFDLRAPERVELGVFAARLDGQLFSAAGPLELIEAMTRTTGRMQPLPEWTQRGAVLGTTGGAPAVRRLLDRCERFGVPVAGVFLQDWVGERRTAFGKRLWWSWTADPGTYGDWKGFVRELNGRGYQVLAYLNPFLTPLPARLGRRDLHAEALAQGYLVRRADGRPYPIASGGFDSSLVDLTNPAARAWYKRLIREQLLDAGVAGWMSDFCEQLPYDARIARGDPRRVHNLYPELFQRMLREAIAEAGKTGEVVFFARSGTLRSPGTAPLFWLGDQMVGWDEHDGLRSSLIGLLSGGVSGYALNHGDIGGYLSVRLFGVSLGYRRSRELLLRWAELGAFQALFRTHDANSDGHQVESSDEATAGFARAARLFRALAPVRRALQREAAARGLPLVRAMALHHSQDPVAWGLDRQFLYGSDLLVAPALEPGARRVRVYLPAGRWVHLWTATVYGRTDAGSWVEVPAPLGQPPVLFPPGSPRGLRLARELVREGQLEAPLAAQLARSR